MDAIKEAHYNLGIAYLEAGQYDRAVPEFEAAIKLDANFIGAHCALCRAYLEQNELEKASTSVRAALKLDATHQPALLLCDTLTQAYYNKGKDHLNAERYTEAVSTFQKTLTLNADLGRSSQVSDIENKHIYAHLGVAHIRLEAYQEAIEALQNAIVLDADLVDAHYYLGYAYVEQGSHDKAIPHLERAIAIAPNLKRAHYHLARAYRKSGNLEAATHAVTETLRFDPNYQRAHELANAIKQAHYNRGITYLNDERYSEAVTAFQNAITLDPDFTTAHYNLGLTYLKMETYARAVDALQKTITLDRTYKAAHHSLALAYLGQQELGKARAAARETLKLDPNYQPALLLLAAIDPSFTSPETQTPASPEPVQPANEQPGGKPRQETHYELGTAYKTSKMYTEAIAEFQKAIDLDANFVAAYVSLGAVYLEMGQLDAAETAANAALRIDANSQSARQLLDAIRQARPPVPRQTEQTKPVSSPPDSSDVKQDLERGLRFLNNGQYQQAAAAFKRVIKADPSSIEAYYGLGQAYLEIGAFDDATTATEEALRRNPNHQGARELLQIIKFARNIERNQKIRKKVLKYAAILGVIALGVFGGVKFGFISWFIPSGPPDISIAAALEEPSGNSFLDAGEKGRLRLTIRNQGGTARNIRIKFDPAFITGVEYKQPDIISKLGKNRTENVAVEMTVSEHARTRTQALKILLVLVEDEGEILVSKDFPLRIRGARRR
ncbi:MAG: tetratricopeptide repeat protein [Candidatus Poribacteria bacterium]|nr:tetratricopeptide repeat protein [Candidatus Poribacteria bacterium]